VASNNQPQITSVTSESLQQQIRNLLPSQQGFGFDLMAQNVIVPIIDLTATAAGTTLPSYLQNAYTLTNATEYEAENATVNIVATPGFWQINASIYSNNNNSLTEGAIRVTDGITTKLIWGCSSPATGGAAHIALTNTFVVLLSSGETLQAYSETNQTNVRGSVRQIADTNGVLINPSGFNPQ